MQVPVIILVFLIASCKALVWKRLPGAAIDISAKGDRVWVINSDQQIFRWADSDWQHIIGHAVNVGTSPDGWTWVVNRDDDIFRYNVDNGNFDNIVGKLIQVSAMSKDKAFGVNRENNMYLYENNEWTQIPGPPAMWVGIGDGDERWMLNTSQQIFRWNHETSKWDRKPGTAVNIDVQSASRIIMTNANKRMYVWKNNLWVKISGTASKTSINEKNIFACTSSAEIWIAEEVDVSDSGSNGR